LSENATEKITNTLQMTMHRAKVGVSFTTGLNQWRCMPITFTLNNAEKILKSTKQKQRSIADHSQSKDDNSQMKAVVRTAPIVPFGMER